MEDGTLIEQAKKGNWDAYLALALPIRNTLYYKALSLLRNELDAADAVGETIVRGYNSIKALQKGELFQTWLVRILINTSIDMLRKAQKTVCLCTYVEDSSGGAVEPADIRLDIRRQLDQLDARQRSVIILRYYEDLKIEDIAEILDIPPGTVKSRLYYGLKNLRITMEGVQANEV